MKEKGLVGWLLLVAALAVPGALFYNWWSRQNAAHHAELEKRVRNRLPPGTPMFTPASAGERLDNPFDRPAAVAAPAAPAATPAVSTGATPPAAVAAAAPAPAPAPALTPMGDQPAAGLPRDPMLSPYDLVRLEQLSLDAELRKKDFTAAGSRAKARSAERPIESEIDLQGIVSTDRGDRAIVNGETVFVGQRVKGAKVVRITAQSVVFVYKGRRFSKTIK